LVIYAFANKLSRSPLHVEIDLLLQMCTVSYNIVMLIERSYSCHYVVQISTVVIIFYDNSHD